MQKGLNTKNVLVFGEVLFDVFSDGETVLGGAPFNVAWHLQGFGANPLFVSRVGKDARGEEVRAAMTRWGMRTDGLQEDSEHPTGIVTITTRNGQPQYQIVPEQAYDYINDADSTTVVGRAGVRILYHGTLALRGHSSAALTRLRELRPNQVFLDLNLRSPWWQPETVRACIELADVVKCNQEEFQQIAAQNERTSLEQAAPAFLRQYTLKALIVTRGDSGATLFSPHGPALQAAAGPVPDLVDTVGAGDAFSAILLLAEIGGWSPETALTRATQFAALACGWRGATIQDGKLYKDLLERWKREPG